MRCRSALLLAATVLLSSVNVEATGIANMATPSVPGIGTPNPRAAQYGAPTKRMLRTVNPEDEDEDRVLEGFTKLFSSTDAEMKGWLRNRVSTNTVLTRLNEHGRVHNSLSGPAIKRLAKYISKYNERFNAQETMVGTLTRAYSDEAVARMIQAEMRSRDTTTKTFATQLEAEQFHLWFNGEENSPLDIFKRLNLVKNGEEAVGSAAFGVLRGDAYEAGLRYLSYFNHHNQGNEISVFKVLREGYGDRQLALMIEDGKWDHSISATALSMQLAQFKYWDEELKATPRNVYGVFNPQHQSTVIDAAIEREYFEYLRMKAMYGANH